MTKGKQKNQTVIHERINKKECKPVERRDYRQKIEEIHNIYHKKLIDIKRTTGSNQNLDDISI